MLPTGAGKTVVASAVIHGAVAKGKRILFLVHRRELVIQAVKRLADWGVEAGVIAAGWEPAPERPVQVASIQTLIRRARPTADVVIVDECQHARSETWEELLDHYSPPAGCCECEPLAREEHEGPCRLAPSACIIGLSATPYRLDGRGLGRTFGCVLNPVTVRQLCELGVLIAPRLLAPPGPDLRGVRKVAGEYDLGQVEERMRNLTGDIVSHWMRHARLDPLAGRTPLAAPGSQMKTVAFAISIAHSEALVERFLTAGVRAAHLDGTAGATERDNVLGALAHGELDLVSNCMVLGEGWDLPELQCAILARPTASLALHRQQIGRIMRAAPDKNGALVLDHAGNTHRHGLVTSEVEVSLDDRARIVEESPTKTCSECFCVVPANAQVCPECGHEWEVEHKDKTRETDEELVEIQTTAPEDREAWYRGLVAEANLTRKRLGWARYRYQEVCGAWPNAAPPAGIGRSKAAAAENRYDCWTYEPKKSEWGERCGRCFRDERAHEKSKLERAMMRAP